MEIWHHLCQHIGLNLTIVVLKLVHEYSMHDMMFLDLQMVSRV